ncbi:MAG: transglycosylase domain-containing protein [Actinomycetota bacterium]|nr:transglycosylase domain-containing protein [Actinomycetota bacterium]
MRTLARLLCIVVVAGLGLAGAFLLLAPQVRDLLTAGRTGADREIDLQPLATRSVVYAADGSVLTTLHAEENRIPVPLDKVPEHVVRAILDAEDDRFWDHGPLDLRAMTRALVANVESGGIFQGGSTITQQLVKTAILTPRQDVNRKIQEAALAVRLEQQMSKREILERYVNTVYFGNGQYGLEAASERYFGHDVTQLTLGEGILLASLIRNPVGGDPWTQPQEALTRRALVADRMRDLGHITAEQAEAVKSEPLPTPPPERPAQGSDYFTEHVKQRLLGDARLGATAQERIQAVFKGGLHIHTTLDPTYQRLAEEKVATIIPDTEGLFGAALVSVEPQTGAVRALVGGSGFDQSKFNLVTDGPGRQTGSAFKTFTLLAALEAGHLTSDTILGTSPCSIPNPGSVDDPWEPKNVEGSGGGVLTLTEATVNSVNCAYARLIKLIGPQKVVDVAQRMGITNHLEPNLSLTLGSSDVTPLQMANAYATLAADGERRAPYFIERVDDSGGRMLFKAEPKPERAISAQNARTVNQVLTQVVSRGTGTAAFIPGWSGGIGGKTGSTDNNTNAWFVGYTQDLATAVWMGSPGTEQRSMSNVGGIRVYGGTYPAMVWGAFMRAVEADKTPTRFPAPDPLTTRASKMLLLPGEQPVVEFAPSYTDEDYSPPTPVFEDGDGPLTSTTVGDRGSDGTTPSTNDIFDDFDDFDNFDDFDDDDSPNTTRTSRPPRPRDLTTLPGP